MYIINASKNRKTGFFALLVLLLLSFASAIFFNNFILADAIDNTRATKLFAGENISVEVTPGGTKVSNANGSKDAVIKYSAALPFIYQRTIATWDEANDSVTTTTNATEYFDLRFTIQSLDSDNIEFEFVDYTNSKKAVKIDFDFSNFKIDYDTNTSTFDFSVIVSYTTDGWNTTIGGEAAETTEISGSSWVDATDYPNGYFDGKDFRLNILEDIEFGLSISSSGFVVTRRHVVPPENEGDPVVYTTLGTTTLWAPTPATDLRFFHDTGKMNISYKNSRETSAAGGTVEVTTIFFKQLNGQALSDDSVEVERALPVFNMDKKVEKPLYATNFSTYDGLQTARKAGVTFPILITDVASYNVYGFIEIWELDSNGSIVGDEPIDTKSFTWGSSGISYNFENEGLYEIRIYAASLNDSEEVKSALKETDTEEYGYGKVITTKLTYKVVNEKTVTAPVLVDASGVALKTLVNNTFTTPWQNLPKYQTDFEFPRPDNLFTNNVDEDYTLSFSIGYKHESDSAYTWSDSLSFRITKTGLFKFKYVVKAPSGKKNTDENSYFYDEDYPEFELRFSDVDRPEFSLATYQTTQTLSLGAKFTTPTPSVTDNSYDGGIIITDETRVYHAYKDWSAVNGLLKPDSTDLLDEVEFDDNGGYALNNVGVYYFLVFYQAKDTHNNKTPDFPSDPTDINAIAGEFAPENLSKSFILIKVTVEEPEEDTNSTLLIILIVLGSLSFLGILALIFIKPIDENKWNSRHKRAID